MAHMAGNEQNFDISSKKYDVQKSIPQKYKTACALGLNPIPGGGALWPGRHKTLWRFRRDRSRLTKILDFVPFHT